MKIFDKHKDKLDFEEKEFSKLIEYIGNIDDDPLTGDFDMQFRQKMADAKVEIPFFKKLKLIFSLKKIDNIYFPHLINYRIIAALSICILVGFMFYSSFLSQNNSQLAHKNNSVIKPVPANDSAKVNKNNTSPVKPISIDKGTLIAQIVKKDFNNIGFDEIAEPAQYRGNNVMDIKYVPGIYTNDDKHTGDINKGKGSLFLNNGDKYEGEFNNDKFNGFGTYFWKDGTKYNGYWKNGVMSGKGTMLYFNGNKYTGNWVNNLREGNGSFTLKDKTVFTGNWQNDELSGQALMKKSDGETYSGLWNEGLADGYGTYKWNNGYKYTGEWNDGFIEGKGILIFPDSTKITAIWKANKLLKLLNAEAGSPF